MKKYAFECRRKKERVFCFLLLKKTIHILFIKFSPQEPGSCPTTNPYLLTPEAVHRALRQSSRRSIYSVDSTIYSFQSRCSSRASAASEYQCSSDPQEILKLGKNLSRVLPIIRRSKFLGILLAVFLIFAGAVLGSILLIIFSIWI